MDSERGAVLTAVFVRSVLPVLLALAACAGPKLYGALLASDRSAFEACVPYVEQRACSQHRDSFVRQFCLSDVAERYAALPTPDDRRAFLVEAGCPEALVASTH